MHSSGSRTVSKEKKNFDRDCQVLKIIYLFNHELIFCDCVIYKIQMTNACRYTLYNIWYDIVIKQYINITKKVSKCNKINF